MPRALARACRKPMCPKTTTAKDGWCMAHRKQVRREEDQRRGSAASRLYDHRWRKARARYLLEHPLCAECMRQRQVTAAVVVDHIIPHHGDLELFWDEGNWQGLCNPCNDVKTAKDRRRMRA